MHQIRSAGFSLANISATRLSCAPGNAGDALDLLGRPLLDLLAHVIHAVDALRDELLVLPAVLEDVPEHAPDHRDVGAGPDAHIFGGMRGGAREARIDDDEIRALSSLPSSRCCSDTGCASAGLPPMMIMVLELRMSL